MRKEILFSSRYHVIKLLLATGGFFSPNLQGLPATNKKKLARHEIYTVGGSYLRPSSSGRHFRWYIFWRGYFHISALIFINTINPCWDWRLMRYRWSDYRRSLSGLLHVCHAKYAWQSDWAHSSWLCLVFSSLTINSFTILVYNWETTIIIASTYDYRHIRAIPHTFTIDITTITSLTILNWINRKQVILCFPFSSAL